VTVFDGQLPADFVDEPLPFGGCVLPCGPLGLCNDGHGTFWVRQVEV
jgi:hypothetical protein